MKSKNSNLSRPCRVVIAFGLVGFILVLGALAWLTTITTIIFSAPGDPAIEYAIGFTAASNVNEDSVENKSKWNEGLSEISIKLNVTSNITQNTVTTVGAIDEGYSPAQDIYVAISTVNMKHKLYMKVDTEG